MRHPAGKTKGKPAITGISCLFSGKNIHIKNRRLIFRNSMPAGMRRAGKDRRADPGHGRAGNGKEQQDQNTKEVFF